MQNCWGSRGKVVDGGVGQLPGRVGNRGMVSQDDDLNRLGKFGQRCQSHRGALIVKAGEDVAEDERKDLPGLGILLQGRQSQCPIELVVCVRFSKEGE